MKIQEYDSYDEYKDLQVRANLKKIKKVFCEARDLNSIIQYLEERNLSVSTGVCHGVRRGWEVKHLRDNLKADIFGTEISHTATSFDNVIEWDFHDIKDEWRGYFDIIYSNSFDHSYKPEECLDTWMETLSENGRLFLHWTKYSKEKYSKLYDPFGASKNEYTEMIEKKFTIESVIKINKRDTNIFVVKR